MKRMIDLKGRECYRMANIRDVHQTVKYLLDSLSCLNLVWP